MSSRSVSGGATSSAPHTRRVWREWAAQAATSWQPRLCATSSAGRIAGQQHLFEPRHPVAAPRPQPVVLLHALVAVQLPPSGSASGRRRSRASPAAAGHGARSRGVALSLRITVAAILRPHEKAPRVRRRPGRHHRPAHPRVPGRAQRHRGAAASTPTSARTRAERARLLNAADVAFLCLPDAAAREAAALVDNPNTCLIDASTAHRTAPGWAFGLPELAPGQREALRAAKRIANPGCHCHRLHPAAAAAGRCRPGGPRLAGHGDVDHRLFGRRQEDDRAVRRPPPRQVPRQRAARSAAALCAGAQPQARAGNDGPHRPDGEAGVHADRRQLLQGPGGERAAALVAAEARHRRRRRMRATLSSGTTRASVSSA